MKTKIDYRLRQNRHRNMSLEERFWAKVDKKDENECWEWKAMKHEFGYGQFNYDGKIINSHRISYVLTHGNIPEGLFVLHRCNNPPCVNPRHLYIGTHSDNMKQEVDDGRSCYGEKNPNSKLSWEVVNRLRKEYLDNNNVTIYELSCKYSIAMGTVGHIISGDKWIDTEYASNRTGREGEHNSHAKLTWEKVNKIREEHTNSKNVTLRSLANTYNVSEITIRNIIKNKAWKDINYKQRR